MAEAIVAADAQVAQLVEHATENRSVGSSILSLGTTNFKDLVDRPQTSDSSCGSIARPCVTRAASTSKALAASGPIAILARSQMERQRASGDTCAMVCLPIDIRDVLLPERKSDRYRKAAALEAQRLRRLWEG